jgi:hypothetical protein
MKIISRIKAYFTKPIVKPDKKYIFDGYKHNSEIAHRLAVRACGVDTAYLIIKNENPELERFVLINVESL